MFSDKSELFAGKYQIPEKTPDPININTTKVHQIYLNTPFHLYATLSDKVIVYNNGDIGRYASSERKKSCN